MDLLDELLADRKEFSAVLKKRIKAEAEQLGVSSVSGELELYWAENHQDIDTGTQALLATKEDRRLFEEAQDFALELLPLAK